jgi:hypothetical protein
MEKPLNVWIEDEIRKKDVLSLLIIRERPKAAVNISCHVWVM